MRSLGALKRPEYCPHSNPDPFREGRGVPVTLRGHSENQPRAKPGTGSEVATPCRQNLSMTMKTGECCVPHFQLEKEGLELRNVQVKSQRQHP